MLSRDGKICSGAFPSLPYSALFDGSVHPVIRFSRMFTGRDSRQGMRCHDPITHTDRRASLKQTPCGLFSL